MARYLLVQVDRNDTAERLRERLDAVSGLKVIAMFAKPTQFCECEVPTERSKMGRKYGWWCCPQCGHPKTDALQPGLKNLLDPRNLPVQYRMVYLGIKEPFRTPAERYGQKNIDIVTKQIAENWIKIQRVLNRKRRPRERRPRARR